MNWEKNREKLKLKGFVKELTLHPEPEVELDHTCVLTATPYIRTSQRNTQHHLKHFVDCSVLYNCTVLS